MTRTAFAALRDVNYVKSARLMGASSGRILVRQILPNTTQVLLPAITIGFNNAVLAEASMSYLGIGVTPPDASPGLHALGGAGDADQRPLVCPGFRRRHRAADLRRGSHRRGPAAPERGVS